jgi:hypothetical protein
LAHNYEEVYRKSVPKLQRLWIAGAFTSLIALAIDVCVGRADQSILAPPLQVLGLIAVATFGTAIAFALDLAFREANILGWLIVLRRAKHHPDHCLHSWIVGMLRNASALPGIVFLVTSLIPGLIGSVRSILVGVGISLFVARFLAGVAPALDRLERAAQDFRSSNSDD